MRGFRKWEREWLRRRSHAEGETVIFRQGLWKRIQDVKVIWYNAADLAEKFSHPPKKEK